MKMKNIENEENTGNVVVKECTKCAQAYFGTGGCPQCENGLYRILSMKEYQKIFEATNKDDALHPHNRKLCIGEINHRASMSEKVKKVTDRLSIQHWREKGLNLSQY